MSPARLLLPALFLAGPVHAFTYSWAFSTEGTANIFSAGRDNTQGLGGGTPARIIILAPGKDSTLTVSRASGATHNTANSPAWGPDGFSSSVNINPAGGLSGFHAGRAMALLGVFLEDTAPTGEPPPTIDFTSTTGIGRNFTSLSPEIGQVFMIGDGYYSNTGQHVFHLPPTATRMYVGFADAGGFQGNPSNFSDNSGHIYARFTFNVPDSIPEPSAAALLAAVSGLTLTARHRPVRPAAAGRASA